MTDQNKPQQPKEKEGMNHNPNARPTTPNAKPNQGDAGRDQHHPKVEKPTHTKE
jgi:hypothetical protein